MSKVIKSNDLDKNEYSNFEYEDCTPENFKVPFELFPSLDEIVEDVKIPVKETIDKNIKIPEKEIKKENNPYKDMRLKAEVYLQQAKERSEEKFQEAIKKGYKQGFDEGLKASEEKQQKLLENYTKELEKLSKLREEVFKRSEKGIMNLVLKISKKILNAELSLNPELVRAIVKAGIERAVSPGKMKLRINPQDAKYIQDNLIKITGSTEVVRNIIVERDETIDRGSCIVTNNYGEIDARIEEQLKEIEKECMKFLD